MYEEITDTVCYFRRKGVKMASDVIIYQEMIDEIKEIMQSARDNAARQVNGELLSAYWNIGRVIVKTGKLMAEAVGQLNMYLNYYASEVNEPGDNPPIGIILCTDKDNVSAEYALGGLSNNIFASTYTYVIPEKEKLSAQVEAVLKQWEDGKKD